MDSRSTDYTTWKYVHQTGPKRLRLCHTSEIHPRYARANIVRKVHSAVYGTSAHSSSITRISARAASLSASAARRQYHSRLSSAWSRSMIASYDLRAAPNKFFLRFSLSPASSRFHFASNTAALQALPASLARRQAGAPGQPPLMPPRRLGGPPSTSCGLARLRHSQRWRPALVLRALTAGHQ